MVAACTPTDTTIDERAADRPADPPALVDPSQTSDAGSAPSATPLTDVIDPGDDASELLEFAGELSIADFSAGVVPIAIFPLAQLSIVGVKPIRSPGTAVAVQRVSSDIPGVPDEWRVKFDLWVQNNGPEAVTVTGIEISYPPGGPTPHIDDASPYKDRDGDPITQRTINPGRVVLVRAHDTRTNAFPVPGEATVSLTIAGFALPFVSTHEMAEYANETPTGGYRFPALAADQPDGHYWYQSGFHADTLTQKYAYDLGVFAWDEGAERWSSIKPGTDGLENKHYLIWNTPVYAMASGTIIGCRRSEPDNDIPQSRQDPKVFAATAGGNAIWVLNDNGDIVEYAHMKQFSVPESICPVESVRALLNADPVRIETGRFLGRVGNTGTSSGPHLHFHIQDGGPFDYDVDGGDFVGFPLLFDHLSLQNYVDFNPKTDEFDWRRVPDDQPGALPQSVLVSPNECGFNIPPNGFPQVVRVAVTSVCWPEVFDTVRLAGYQLDYIEGFNVSGELFFNAIFNPDDGNPWAVHHVTSSRYQALFDELTADGFRLFHIDSYVDGGQVFYAAIFDQRDGPPWVAYHGLTDVEHQAEFDRLFADGYHPVNISVTSVAGVRSYAAVYELGNVGGFASQVAVPISQVEATITAWDQAGLHPVYVKAYEHAGNSFVSMIGEGAGMATAIEVSIGVAQLRLAHFQRLDEAWRMISVTGYNADGGQYIAVWSPVVLRDTRTQPGDTRDPIILEVVVSPLQTYQGLEGCGPTSLTVSAVVSGPSAIKQVALRYRLGFEGIPSVGPFESVTMTESAGTYSVELATADLPELPRPGITAPPQAVVQLFVEATDEFGNTGEGGPDGTVLVDRC